MLVANLLCAVLMLLICREGHLFYVHDCCAFKRCYVTARGGAGCKRLKRQTASAKAHSGHGIILSDSDSDTDTDMEDSSIPARPAPQQLPSARAPASRHRGQRDADLEWEAEAAGLAEDEASLDVSLC